MSKINETLSEVFDILPPENNQPIQAVKPIVSQKVEDDFDVTRANLLDLLAQGQDALANALELAKAGENPRAYEVVGTMMSQISDINKQLMDLHLQKQKIENNVGGAKRDVVAPTVQNNSIFVGSSSELSKMIKDMKKDQNGSTS